MELDKKAIAQRKVHNAILRGKLKRPEYCQLCGSNGSPLPKRYRHGNWFFPEPHSAKIIAHHDDYDKPLIVKWVCRSCHWAIHHGGENGER